MKNPVTPAGIEPATFRIVAQHLNHCATGQYTKEICQNTNTGRLPNLEGGGGKNDIKRRDQNQCHITSECNQSVRLSWCGPVWTPDQIFVHVLEISVALSSGTLSEGSVGWSIVCSYCRCWLYIFTYLKFKAVMFKPLIQVFSVLSFASIVLPSPSLPLHDEEARWVVIVRIWHYLSRRNLRASECIGIYQLALVFWFQLPYNSDTCTQAGILTSFQHWTWLGTKAFMPNSLK